LIDEGFQSPTYTAGTGSPAFAGWSYENGGSVKVRNGGNDGAPGASTNQLLQLEWNSAKLINDVDHAWGVGEEYTISLNASPQAWNGDKDRAIKVTLLQDDGTELWSGNADLPKYDASFSGGAWTAAQTFEFTVNSDDFTAGTAGESLRLKIE